VAVCCVLAGCGGGSSTGADGPLSGAFRSQVDANNGLTLKFTGTSAVEITVIDGGRSQVQNASYSMNGDQVVILIPGESRSLTLVRNGGGLDAAMEGMTMHFKRI
jgi:hypothetical protein